MSHVSQPSFSHISLTDIVQLFIPKTIGKNIRTTVTVLVKSNTFQSRRLPLNTIEVLLAEETVSRWDGYWVSNQQCPLQGVRLKSVWILFLYHLASKGFFFFLTINKKR